jgi:predicted 2-oxoglutarate/Fe(II)-dependent dioxygenase YbiX
VLRLNRYLPGHGGHGMHTDYGGREPAKLAFSILLRAPAAGGETRIEYYDEDPVVLRPGDGVIFPGYEPHEVRAVTEGERISLTGWLGGPPLR